MPTSGIATTTDTTNIITPIATPSSSATPTYTPAPQPTPTPLARTIAERPTPIPAPNCFTAPPPSNTSKDYATSVVVADERILVSLSSPVLSRTTIYISDDEGATWTTGHVFFSELVNQLVPSPNVARDNLVFASGSGGVYRSFDGGFTWVLLTPLQWATGRATVRRFAVSPDFVSDRLLWFSSTLSPRGVYSNTDNGFRWGDWMLEAVDGLFVSPNYALDRAVWVTRNDERTFHRDVVVTFNQGDSWEVVHAGNTRLVAVSPAYAQDSTLLWEGYQGGLYISRNGDKIFPTLEKTKADVLNVWQFNPQTGWVVAGEQPISAIVFSPNFARDRTAFATTTQAFIVTRDGGSSWSPSCYWGYDAQKPEALRFDQLAISSGFATDQTLYAVGAGTRVAISRDGGQTWATVPLK
jgi:photosystem II stability/assembly factor-like uncharacterized protein